MPKPILLAFCLLLLLPASDVAGAEPIVLRPDRVFTSEDRQLHSGWVVVVEGNRIGDFATSPQALVGCPVRDRVTVAPAPVVTSSCPGCGGPSRSPPRLSRGF